MSRTQNLTAALYAYTAQNAPQEMQGRQFQQLRLYGYNPAQPRDKGGKWTHGSQLGGADHAKAADHLAGAAAKAKGPVHHALDALRRAHHMLHNLKSSTAEAGHAALKRIGQHLSDAAAGGHLDGNPAHATLLAQGREALGGLQDAGAAKGVERAATSAPNAQAHAGLAASFAGERQKARAAKQYSVAARHHAQQLAHETAGALASGQDAAPHLEKMGKAVSALRAQAYHARKKGDHEAAFLRLHAANHYAAMRRGLKAQAAGKGPANLTGYGKAQVKAGLEAHAQLQQQRAGHTAQAQAYESAASGMTSAAQKPYGQHLRLMAALHHALAAGDVPGALKLHDQIGQTPLPLAKSGASAATKAAHKLAADARNSRAAVLAPHSPEIAHDQAFLKSDHDGLGAAHRLIHHAMKNQRQGNLSAGVDAMLHQAGQHLKGLKGLSAEDAASLAHAQAGLKTARARQAYAQKSTLDKAGQLKGDHLSEFHNGLYAGAQHEANTTGEYAVAQAHLALSKAHERLHFGNAAEAAKHLASAKSLLRQAGGSPAGLSALHKKALRLGNTSAKVLGAKLGAIPPEASADPKDSAAWFAAASPAHRLLAADVARQKAKQGDSYDHHDWLKAGGLSGSDLTHAADWVTHHGVDAAKAAQAGAAAPEPEVNPLDPAPAAPKPAKPVVKTFPKPVGKKLDALKGMAKSHGQIASELMKSHATEPGAMHAVEAHQHMQNAMLARVNGADSTPHVQKANAALDAYHLSGVQATGKVDTAMKLAAQMAAKLGGTPYETDPSAAPDPAPAAAKTPRIPNLSSHIAGLKAGAEMDASDHYGSSLSVKKHAGSAPDHAQASMDALGSAHSALQQMHKAISDGDQGQARRHLILAQTHLLNVHEGDLKGLGGGYFSALHQQAQDAADHHHEPLGVPKLGGGITNAAHKLTSLTAHALGNLHEAARTRATQHGGELMGHLGKAHLALQQGFSAYRSGDDTQPHLQAAQGHLKDAAKAAGGGGVSLLASHLTALAHRGIQTLQQAQAKKA